MTGAVEIVAATTDDAERWCGVVNAVGPHDRRSPARYRHMRTVVDPRGIHLLALADGREVGAASAFCPPWIGGDDLIVGGVWVLPEARGQGTGSTLLARVEAAASARGGLRFGAGVHEHDEPGRRFAERHGYAVEEVIRRVSLQLADAPLRQPAWPDGVRLTTLADEPGLLHALYELDMRTGRDIPSTVPAADMSYDQWLAAFAHAPGVRPEAVFVAVRGAQPVGYAALGFDDVKPTVATHMMTAVERDERGHGLATALKLATIEWARAAGIEELETENHDGNAPMRAVNAKLGYRPLPAELLVRRTLARHS